MTPEDELTLFASRIHLPAADADYLRELLRRAARAAGHAGARYEREACALVADRHQTLLHDGDPPSSVRERAIAELTSAQIAYAIRGRSEDDPAVPPA